MPLSVPKGSTILEAARYAGIEIPTLCYLKEINEIGACRICVVEVKGARNSGRRLRLSGERGHGGIHQHPKGSGVPQNHPGADPLHPQQKLPVLRAQRQLRAAEAVPRLRRGRRATLMTAKSPPLRLGRLRRSHGARQQQVHSLPPLRRRLRQMAGCWRSSAPTTGALTPISAAPLSRTWATWPAYPAASVSSSAPPAR